MSVIRVGKRHRPANPQSVAVVVARLLGVVEGLLKLGIFHARVVFLLEELVLFFCTPLLVETGTHLQRDERQVQMEALDAPMAANAEAREEDDGECHEAH